MFEDFRKQLADDKFPEDDQQREPPAKPIHQEQRLFGMTPIQRFIVALMLLLMVIILGVLFLLVTSKIVPPFLA